MYPIFITDDPDEVSVISSLPGQKRWGVNRLEEVRFSSPSELSLPPSSKHVRRSSWRRAQILRLTASVLTDALYGLSLQFLTPLVKKGLKSVILFGVPHTLPKVRLASQVVHT